MGRIADVDCHESLLRPSQSQGFVVGAELKRQVVALEF
jgi:hypothetical protein